MKSCGRVPLFTIACGLAFAGMLADAPALCAATVWLGPLISYNQPSPDPTQAANQDRITPDMWLTRGTSKGLFNAFSETNATALSPAGTEWAFGEVTNFASLPFTNWIGLLNGKSPSTLVGQPMVVHLTADDIYISIDISFWGSMSGGGFTYERSTPPPISLSDAVATNGQISFSYMADPSQSSVVESSSDLVVWVPVVTNAPSVSPIGFSDSFNAIGAKFYRASQLGNL